jgi:hypothetical protein
MGADRERRGRRLLQSAAGGALAGVAFLLCLEFLGTFLHMLGLPPLPWWDQAVAVALVAAVGGVVGGGARWRGGRAAAVLDEAAPVVVRHALFFILLVYSVSKLMGAQFRLPYAALDIPLGSARGYALTWRFFGYSYGYEAFVAGGQLVGAALLLSWRTTTLGACVLVGVLSNIVVVNFTHDLPVKLASTCYLVMSGYLIVPDLGRLWALFVANKPFGARPPPAGVGWPRSPVRRIALRAAFVVVSVAHAIAFVELGDSRPTPISGAWAVEAGADRAGGPHDWRVVYFERGFGGSNRGSVRVGAERGTVPFRYEVEPDGRLRMEFAEGQRANDFVGTYELAGGGTCLLRGTRGAAVVAIRLVRERP